MNSSLTPKTITIVFYYHKPRIARNFSIEGIFNSIQKNLPQYLKSKTAVSRYHSNGLWKRIYNIFEAAFRQGDLNHITGDVHFLALLLKKKKTILTIHDCGFMNHPSKIARIILRWFWLVLPIYRSRIVTVMSEATKAQILKHVHCLPDKIRVIPCFISEKYRVNPKPFNSVKPIILHIGTAPNKNLERLIVSLFDIPCHLKIIGRLTGLHYELLKTYNIDHSNCYNLEEDEVLRHYEQCDLVAFVSTYEGFGLPILETQAIGRPVVTSNLFSMPEVAGDAACFVDPYSVEAIRTGIVQVIQDEIYRQQLIHKGWENVKRYSLASTTAQYTRLYTEMME